MSASDGVNDASLLSAQMSRRTASAAAAVLLTTALYTFSLRQQQQAIRPQHQDLMKEGVRLARQFEYLPAAHH